MRSFLAVFAGSCCPSGRMRFWAYTLFPGLAHSQAITNVWLFIVTYCSLYSAIGGYLTARLAPNRPVDTPSRSASSAWRPGLLGVFFGPRRRPGVVSDRHRRAGAAVCVAGRVDLHARSHGLIPFNSAMRWTIRYQDFHRAVVRNPRVLPGSSPNLL